MAEVTDDLEKEKPSTTKQGLQRWLIAAGIVFTLLCVYIFVVSSRSASNQEEVKTVEVPRQTQEGELSNSNAIARFKEDVQNREKVTPRAEGLNSDVTPTYSVPKSTSMQTINEQRGLEQQLEDRDELIKQLLAERENSYSPQPRTPFNGIGQGQQSQSKNDALQALQEQEKERAFKSLQSKDTIGNANAFYESNSGSNAATSATNQGNAQPANNFLQSIENEPLEVRQAKVKQQIARTNQVLEMINRGEIDPSNIPPDMLQMMQGGR